MVGHVDIQIAAIAKARRMAVATRDADFDVCEVTVINPWSAG
jgi:predicted nucleic acid-binding protein